VEKVIFRETDGFGHTLRIIICDRAWWRTIDGEYQEQGKAILLLEIRDEKIALPFSQAPTHEAVCKIVDAILEVELYNDLYEFSYGRRKTQIFKKIDELERRLNHWRRKAKMKGLTEEMRSRARSTRFPSPDGH